MAKKVLFLPFLQMQSGHHQVADALAEYAARARTGVVCRKVDLFTYGFSRLEAWASAAYLKWIRYAPQSYHWLYARTVDPETTRSFSLYVRLFLPVLARLLAEEKPDLVVCTHALPSRLMQVLKTEARCDIPVVNAYTDFFINALWGTDGIDYHFVPDLGARERLKQKGVGDPRLFVTGIPVHPAITSSERVQRLDEQKPMTILVTGGHLGVGGLEQLSLRLPHIEGAHYYVLCGKNERLLKKLQAQRDPFLTPVPYISDRGQMNRLYEQADAVLSKPGGVTVSECLRKRKPIFVYGALPGQETFNLLQLKRAGLVFDMCDWRTDHGAWEQKLTTYMRSAWWMRRWQHSVETFMRPLQTLPLTGLFNQLFTTI